jgi:hypothetical protein
MSFNTSQTNQSASLEDFKDQLPPKQQKELDEHLDVEQIKSFVYQLLTETDCPEDNRKRESKKFADLRGKYQQKYMPLMMIYPALYNMIIENGKKFDLTQFEQMMTMISKVRRKEVTEETASQQFGQQMVEKFVKPKLD